MSNLLPGASSTSTRWMTGHQRQKHGCYRADCRWTLPDSTAMSLPNKPATWHMFRTTRNIIKQEHATISEICRFQQKKRTKILRRTNLLGCITWKDLLRDRTPNELFRLRVLQLRHWRSDLRLCRGGRLDSKAEVSNQSHSKSRNQ